jgi:hypothetical protein
MLDLAVFVAEAEQRQRQRFWQFYRWKGLQPQAIEELWQTRAVDEWPAVDAQRASADVILHSMV